MQRITDYLRTLKPSPLTAVAAFVLVTFWSVMAFAQEAAEAVEGLGFWGQVLVILATLVPAILGGLRWGSGLVSGAIEKHVDNEWAKGALLRLMSEIYNLSELVGTTFESLVTDFTKPESEGGKEITRGELKLLATGLVEKLVEGYGGWSQAFDLLKRIGLGETPEAQKARLVSLAEPIVAKALVTKNPQLALAA